MCEAPLLSAQALADFGKAGFRCSTRPTDLPDAALGVDAEGLKGSGVGIPSGFRSTRAPTKTPRPIRSGGNVIAMPGSFVGVRLAAYPIHGRPRFAKPFNGWWSDKALIAAIHPDFLAWPAPLSLMEFADRLLLSTYRACCALGCSGFAGHGLTCLAITS